MLYLNVLLAAVGRILLVVVVILALWELPKVGDVTSQRSLKRRTNFCSPSIEKCANFLRTHSLISFANVLVGGIRFSKASFFVWSDTRKYSAYHFRGSSFMYIFMSTEIKTILNSTRLQIPPFPQRWNYSLLPITALLSYLITSAALMFFLFIL